MGHVIGISKTLCKCGCGEFTSAWSTGNDSQYINGHQVRLGGEAIRRIHEERRLRNPKIPKDPSIR